MKRIAIILAAWALLTGELDAQVNLDREYSQWPEENEDRPARTPLSKLLPSVFGSGEETETATPPESEPAAADPAPQPRKQPPRKTLALPEPEPEPKLTPEQQQAEDKWWQEVGDTAVAAFSRCLGEHVIDETSSGSRSSYPDFVTSAMNGRCAREFAAMAQLILDRHGEDNFARIARKLIATKFVPAVKQVAEGGALPDAVPPKDDRLALEADMRRSKEAMFGCLVSEADRLAAGSGAPEDRVADQVIAACRAMADAYFGKLEQLYPGAAGGQASGNSAAILEASYRPAILQRIATMRGDAAPVRLGGGKADAETSARKGQAALSLKPIGRDMMTPQLTGPEAVTSEATGRAAISPAAEPAPGLPAPASSRP